MAYLEIGPEDGLYYEYCQRESPDGFTFVFFNALTGDTSTWEDVIGPKLRRAGHGTLAYNMRGQTDSPFSSSLTLDEHLIVDDAVVLLQGLDPPRPILVGLSIGGLFAIKAHLRGVAASGVILINTLRKDGPRLKWIGDALVRAVEVGGLPLFRDLFMELLMNDSWLSDNREHFLKPGTPYEPIDRKSGPYKLLSEAGRSADWDIPIEKIEVPVCVITGLQDHVFREPDDIDELFSRFSDGRRIEIADAGHLIPAERPHKLADICLTFAEAL
jgi:pimeloyl-ACP methyl ester carboxylesterase